MTKQHRHKVLVLKKLFILMTFLALPVWAQEGDYDETDYQEDEYQETEYEEDSTQKASETNYEEKLEESLSAAQKDPQKLLQELQKQISPEQLAALQKAMNEGDMEKVKEITNKINLKLTTSGAGLDSMVEVSLQTFRDQSPEALKAQLSQRFEGTLFMPVINTFPGLMDFTVNMLQDRLALPSLFSIVKDRKKLLIFLVINILLFISSKVMKRIKKKQSAFTRWLLFASARFAVLVFFFHKELWPSFIVFKRTFF